MSLFRGREKRDGGAFRRFVKKYQKAILGYWNLEIDTEDLIRKIFGEEYRASTEEDTAITKKLKRFL